MIPQNCGPQNCGMADTVLTVHAARRTFVVHALEEGMSPQIVMTFTSHEDYDPLKPYIAITDKTRKKMMETNF